MMQWHSHRIIPLASLAGPAEADVAAEALVQAGLPIIEIAQRTPYSQEAIRRLASRGDIIVGAGTVLTVDQAQSVLDAGAAFAVTPGFDPDVVTFFQDRDVPILPGVLTPTEVQMALAEGLTQLKLFPANAVNAPVMLDAWSTIYPDALFMPSGGVNATTAPDLLARRNVFAVSGSWMLRQLDEGVEALRLRIQHAKEAVT